MKTAAKVFIIIGMIIGFWSIVPLIVGGIALYQMKTRKPSTLMSILVLLFCSLLGGIFLLCSKDSEYGAPKSNNTSYEFVDEGSGDWT